MADKNLNSITFPGLPDKYKVAQVADEYSSSSTYAVGDIVNYLGTTYRCTTAITTAENWTAGHWTPVKIAKEVTDLKSAIGNKSNLNTDTKTNLVSAINEVNGHFLDGIGNAVENWLDDHPDATTTVQDGSLTEAKFSDALALKTVKDYVTPEMFGAVGDGVTDDHDALVSAFNFAYNSRKTLRIDGVYYSASSISIEEVPVFETTGVVRFGNCNGLVLGKVGSYIENKTIKIRLNKKNSDYTVNHVGLRITNMVNCQVYIDYVSGFDVAVELIGNGGALAYNSFFLNEITGGLHGIKMGIVSSGYANENVFLGGRINTNRASDSTSAGITFEGNNNVFIKPCVESANICFNFINAQNNMILSCRSEGSSYLAKFDNTSRRNGITVGYGTRSIVSNSNFLNYVRAIVLDTLPSKLMDSYCNTVYDSDSLLECVSIGADTSTFDAPLKWINTYSSATPSSTSPAVQTIAVGNKLKIDGGGIGVMVDCSVAKNFAVLQGGSQMGVAFVKLYDENGDLMDMSNISVSPYSTYESGFGGCLLLQNVEASYMLLPSEAKKAFIGVVRTNSSTKPILFKLCIKSDRLSSPIY